MEHSTGIIDELLDLFIVHPNEHGLDYFRRCNEIHVEFFYDFRLGKQRWRSKKLFQLLKRMSTFFCSGEVHPTQ